MNFKKQTLTGSISAALKTTSSRCGTLMFGSLLYVLTANSAYAMTDTDNDGVPDSVEVAEGTDPNLAVNFLDSDGDTIPDYVDVDSDGDNVADVLEYGRNPYIDADMDGIPVYLDDNDADAAVGNADAKVQAAFDPDMNGTAAFQDATHNHERDSDGDGVPDSIEISEGTNESSAASFLDTDGDGIADIVDGDSDGDNIGDLSEDGVYPYYDRDCDGVPAYLDDNDFDMSVGNADNRIQGMFDPDGNNVASFQDNTVNEPQADGDNDGAPDAVENNQGTDPADGSDFLDTDGDGITDYVDLDDDNDTLADIVEGDGDGDGDGLPNNIDTDSDGDGVSDQIEGDQDVDGDFIPNFVDPTTTDTTAPSADDSDGDGISDSVEGQGDPDNDNIVNSEDLDSDGDGILDATETNADRDVDTIPNFLDLDSDADGIADEIEGVVDTDGDGTPNFLDDDSDGDGIADFNEGIVDTDGDGIPAYIDADEMVNSRLSSTVRTGLNGGCVLSATAGPADPGLLFLLLASLMAVFRRKFS